MDSSSHWNDDELIASAYDVAPRTDGHLERCPACAARLRRVMDRRQALLAHERGVPAAFFAAQRRAIQSRLASRASHHERNGAYGISLIPSLAAILLLLVGLMVFGPGPRIPAPQPLSDAELFEEVFTLTADPAPRAMGPVRSLFEVQQ